MGQREERAAWDSVADAWLRWWETFEAGARPLVEALVAGAALAPGMRALDLGCGIGEPALSAARAVGPGGRVVAVDLSERMLQHARARACEAGLANVDFVAAEAHALSAGARFDAAVSRWVLMLTPDPPAAARRVHDALAPGARAAFAVWAEPEHVPFLALPRAAFARELGAEPPAPDAPGPFALSDRSRLERVLREAGFEDVAIEPVTIELAFASPAEYARFVVELSSSARRLLAQASPDARARFERALADGAAQHSRSADSVRLANRSWVAVARRAT